VAFYEGDVIVLATQGRVVRMQIDDTDDRHWEAIAHDHGSLVPDTSGIEPVRVQIVDPEDVRDGGAAPARWAWGDDHMVLVGEDRFRGPRGSG
jgi:hypothetical protein